MKRFSLKALSAAMIIAGGTAISLPSLAYTAESEVIVSPNDKRDYLAVKLENGIEVMLVSDPTVDKSAAALSVGVGLLHDPMTQQGMAHYLEHMLFMGTDKYPDVDGYSNFMSQNGGSSNAYTWLDITNYMFEINNNAYDEALDRFSDFFKSPKLYPEYTEKEKNAVNAEWSMRREMDFFGMFKLNRAMMGKHPANRFLIGNLETLGDKENSKLHPETVDFYNKYYSANIMKVALVSNLPIAEMKKMAEKHFSSIKDKSIEKPHVKEQIDFSELGGKRIHYVPNQDIKQLMIDFTIKNNVEDFKFKPNRYIAYLLDSEMPGTPAYVLKKDGLISNLGVSTSPEQYGNYGQFTISMDLTDAGMKKREEITAVVMNYIEKVRKKGVDKKYFKEIQTSLNNQFRFLEKANSFGYVSNLADEMQSYPAKDVVAAPFTYEKFSADKIQAVLDQLTPERLRVWYVSKEEPHDKQLHFYDGKYKIVDIDKKEIASWKNAGKYTLSLPKINTLLPEGFDLKTASNKMSKPEVVHDKKGITVWQYPSQAFKDQPKGVLRVYFNSPERQTGIEGQILFSIWADLYNLQQSALATEASIAGMGLRLNDANGLELRVNGFTDKQDVLLQKGLSALKFKVEPVSFNQAVDRFVRNIQNSEKQFAYYQLFGQVGNVISSSGYDNEALVEAAKKLKAEDLSFFMDKVLANNQVRVFAFGNYDKKSINYFVKSIEKALPEHRKTTEYTRSKYWDPKKGKTVVFKKDSKVADVGLLDLYVHPEPSLTQEARARVLSSHFQRKTFDKLRTEEQLAYAVAGIRYAIEDYTSLGFLIQTPVKDVESMQKRFDDFKKEYRVELDKVTEDEFAKLKESVLVTLREKPKNLNEEQAPMVNDWYQEKLDFNSRQKLIAEVEKVSLKDIKKFYAETLENPEASRLSIQLRGTKTKDKPFATLKGEEVIKNLADFHKKMDKQG